MAKATPGKKKDNSRKAGMIAFGATLLGIAGIFGFHSLSGLLIGAGVSLIVGSVVKIMATPLKGLETSGGKAVQSMATEDIQDEYARKIVSDGIANMNQLRLARDAVNEYVFTRRINDLSVNFRKLLEQVQKDPMKASRIRKLNTYYLPTAVKMLNRYRDAKVQGMSYQQISSTRNEILEMLDQLLEATQNCYDGMVQDQLADMDIELDVFEQMLKNDGMIDNDLTDDLKQSAQAAARDACDKPVAQPRSQSAPTAAAQQLRQGAPVLNVPDTEEFDSFYASQADRSNQK